ncbi:MAG TPA: hypothetical protein VE198_06275 [Actinoallomurus sp.]|jgi:hypothetical protein|nr:hypothetical protein [Actinoallomurus sp.]
MRRRVTGTVLSGLVLALVPFLSAAANAAPVAVSHLFLRSCATLGAGHASC